MTTGEPSEVECDVVVLGLGPGGEHVAIKLARAGLDVIGIEDRLVGGECPYYGCVPSKMMIRAADALGEARRVSSLGGSVDVRPDWEPVATRIRESGGWRYSAGATGSRNRASSSAVRGSALRAVRNTGTSKQEA